MEALNACPHHGFDTWLLVSYFYDGIYLAMKQLSEWGHAAHIWQYDTGAQHISFKQQACQSRGSFPDWH